MTSINEGADGIEVTARHGAGYVDPHHLQFAAKRLTSVSSIAPHRLDDLQSLDRQHAELFREHGFLEPRDLAAKLRELITRSGVAADVDPVH